MGKSKMVSIVLALMMVFAMLVPAAAAGGACYINDDAETTYPTLTAALSASSDGDVIHLLADVAYESGIKSVTIDGTNTGGANYTLTLASTMQVMHKSVTLSNVTVKPNGNNIWVVQNEKKTSKLILENGCVFDGEGGNAGINGGAVKVERNNNDGTSELVMKSGSAIKNLEVTNMGGAVFLNGGTVTVEGGAEITNCSAGSSGGAIYVHVETSNKNELILSGGTISGCTAKGNGGAIYAATGTVKLSGNVSITGNKKGSTTLTENNIQITENSKLNLVGNFTGSVGVTAPGKTIGDVENDATGAEKIVSDTNSAVVGSVKSGKLMLEKSSVCYINDDAENAYETLNQALSAATAGDTIHLTGNAEWGSGAEWSNDSGKITIDGKNPGGENFTVTLKSKIKLMHSKFTLKNVTVKLNGYHFWVVEPGTTTYAKLTLGEGCVFDGEGKERQGSGGAIELSQNNSVADGETAGTAQVVMESGSVIQNCVAKNNGGAIFVNGGTVTIESGAKISKCKNTAGNGGAIHLQDAKSKLMLMGGTIESCEANIHGGAIYVNGGTVELSGNASVTGNKVGTAKNNIELTSAGTLNLVGNFTGSAGVTAPGATTGTAFGNVKDGVTGAEKIEADAEAGLFASAKAGKLLFYKDYVCYIGDSEETGTGYVSLIKAMQAANGATIHLLKDASMQLESGEDLYGVNGCTIDGTNAEGENYKITLGGYIKFINSGRITFTNVTWDLNKNGIGLYRPDATKTCVIILGNGATVKNGLRPNGGAAQITPGAELVMKAGSLVTECESENVGGAFLVHGGILSLEGGSITDNKAKNKGGGVWVQNDGVVKLKGDADVSNNTSGDSNENSNIGLNTNSGELNGTVELVGDFSGNASVNFTDNGAGKVFGTADKNAAGAYNIKLDTQNDVFGCVSDGKLMLVCGKTELLSDFDGGVIKNGEGVIQSGTLRFITRIGKLEGATVSAYGTYIMPKTVFEEAKSDILKNAGTAYPEYLSMVKNTDSGFTSLSSISSYGVDLEEIPAANVNADYIALSFVKIGGQTVFLEHAELSVSDITDAGTGDIKVLGTLKDTYSLSPIKYRDPDEIYLSDADLNKNVKNIIGVEATDTLGINGDAVTVLTDMKKTPAFVPAKKYVVYSFSQLTAVSGVRTIKADSCGTIKKSIVYGSTNGTDWFKIGKLFGLGDGTLLTDFGFNIKLTHLAVSFDSSEVSAIALADMHIIGENSRYELVEAEAIEEFLIYKNTGSFTVTANTSHKNNPPSYLFDGDKDTFWHSDYQTVGEDSISTEELPHTVTAVFGEAKVISGIRYVPRNGSNKVTRAKVYGTTDGKNYYLIGESEKWTYSGNSDTTPREILFGENLAVTGIKFVIVETQSNVFSTGAEIELIKRDMGLRDNALTDEISLAQREKVSLSADADVSRAWDLSEKTSWEASSLPATVDFTFAEAMSISGVGYTSEEGMKIEEADIYVSEDGTTFKKYRTTAFSNDYTYLFRANLKLKAVRLVIKKINTAKISIDEFKLITECAELDEITLSEEMESKSAWTAESASFVLGKEAEYIIDGDLSTFWHSFYDNTTGERDEAPIDLIVSFGEQTTIGGFNYYPRTDSAAGYFVKLEVYVSVGLDKEGKEVWTKAADESYSYPFTYKVQNTKFPFNYTTDKVKFHVTEGFSGYVTGSEIRFLTPAAGKAPVSARVTPSEVVFEHDEAEDIKISFTLNDAMGLKEFSYNSSPVNTDYYSVNGNEIVLSKYFFEDVDKDITPHDAVFTLSFWIGEPQSCTVKVGGTSRYKVNFEANGTGGSLSAKAVTGSGTERTLAKGDTVRKNEKLVLEATAETGYRVSSWSIENTDVVYEKITDREGWSVTASSTRNEDETACMLDGNANTYWHSGYTLVEGTPQPVEEKDKKPFHITLTFPSETELAGFYYLPRQDSSEGKIVSYEIYTSTDGTSFTNLVASGTVPYTDKADRTEKEIKFGKTVKTNSIQIKILSTSGNWGQIAELYGMRVKDCVCGSVIKKGTVSEVMSIEGLYTDINVKASFEALTEDAAISYELENITSSGPATAAKGTDVTVSFSDKDGYYMPEDVTVIREGTTLAGGTDYIYTKHSNTSATLLIKNVSGAILVKAAGADHDTHLITYRDVLGAVGTLPANESVRAGRSVTVKGGSMTLQGYSFSGWKMTYPGIADEDIKVFAAGESFVMPNADVTLTASWTKTNSGGGAASKPSGSSGKPSTGSGGGIGGGTTGIIKVSIHGVGSVSVVDGKIADPPAKEGYEFAGYYLDEALSVPYSNTGITDEIKTLYPYYRAIRNRADLTDMAEHWAYNEVGELYEAYCVDGRGDGVFDPDAGITRAEFCRILYLMSGEFGQGIDVFEDISIGDWFSQAVAWAYENGIVTGTSEKTFSPYELITREQMAVMIFRYARHSAASWQNRNVPEFTDSADISSWALEAINWSATAGISNGYSDGSFMPKGSATRAEAAVMLLRLKNLL